MKKWQDRFELPKWFGTWKFFEMENFLVLLDDRREEAYLFGYGFVSWVLNYRNFWGECPQ